MAEALKKKANVRELAWEKAKRLIDALEKAGLVVDGTESGWKVSLRGVGQGYVHLKCRKWAVEGKGNLRRLRAILRKCLPRWKNPRSKRCPICRDLVPWDIIEEHAKAHPSTKEQNRQLTMAQDGGIYVRELVAGGDIHRDPVDLTASIVTGVPLRRRT